MYCDESPRSHCHQKFADNLFEEARAVLKDAIQQVCAQCSVDSFVCGFDHLLRRRELRLHFGSRGDRLRIVPTPAEVAKRRDCKQILGIEADGGAGLGVWSTEEGGQTPSAFSDRLRQEADRHYGLAGPAYLAHLAADHDAAADEAHRLIARFERGAVLPEDTSQVQRRARRVAVVAAAGEIAIRAGVLPWPDGTAMQASAKIFDRWALGYGRSRSREDRMAMLTIRDAHEMLQTNFGSAREDDAFADVDRAAESRALDTYGYKWTSPEGDQFFLFADAAWRKVLASQDSRRPPVPCEKPDCFSAMAMTV